VSLHVELYVGRGQDVILGGVDDLGTLAGEPGLNVPTLRPDVFNFTAEIQAAVLGAQLRIQMQTTLLIAA